MNKTDDIEWAIGQALLDGPLTLDDIERRLAAYRSWVGDIRILTDRMLGDGQMRAVGCDHNSHEGACVIEAGR